MHTKTLAVAMCLALLWCRCAYAVVCDDTISPTDTLATEMSSILGASYQATLFTLCLEAGIYEECDGSFELTTAGGGPVALVGVAGSNGTLIDCSTSTLGGFAYITVDGSRIEGLTVYDWGSYERAIVVDESTIDVVIDSVTIHNRNFGEAKGGVVVGDDVVVDIVNCHIEGCNANFEDGGAVSGGAGATITLTRTVFVLNQAAVGYGGVVSSQGLLSVDSCVIDESYAATLGYDGGAVYGSVQIIVNTTFLDTFAGGDGGSLWIESPFDTVVVANSSFVNSESGNSGGAIWVEDAVGLVLESVRFSACTADGDGGAVSVYVEVPTVITDSLVESCSAAGVVGGVSVYDVDVMRTVFTGNFARSLFAQDYTVNLEHAVFSDNWGAAGGVLFASGAAVTAVDTLFVKNSGTLDIVHLFSDTTLVLTRCNFSGNAAGNSLIGDQGGASVLGLTVTDSFVTGVEGGFVSYFIDLTFTAAASIVFDNFTARDADYNSGFVSLVNGVLLQVTNTSLTDVTGPGFLLDNGVDVLFQDNSFASVSTAAAIDIQSDTVEVADHYFTDCYPAVSVDDAQRALLHRSWIELSSYAFTTGDVGAVTVADVTVISSGPIFCASSNLNFTGPGLFDSTFNSVFYFTGTSSADIDGTDVVFTDNGAGNGGIVYWLSSGSLDLRNIYAIRPVATNVGSVLFSFSAASYMNISNVHIADDFTPLYSLNCRGTTDVYNVTVVGTSGLGGVYTGDPSGPASIRDVYLSSGGAGSPQLLLVSGGVITIERVFIVTDGTGLFAAALILSYGTVNVSDTTLTGVGVPSGDTTSAVLLNSGATAVFTDIAVEGFTLENQANSPVMADGASSVTFHRLSVTACSGGTGGAISVEDTANFAVYDSYLGGNSVSIDGGAVVVSGVSSATFVNTVFESNTAVMGGAAAVSGGSASLTLVDCTLVDNSGSSIGSALMCLSQASCSLHDTRLLRSRGSSAVYLLFQSSLTAVDSSIVGSSDDGVAAYGAANVSLTRTTITATAGDAVSINLSPLHMADAVVHGNAGDAAVRLYAAFDVSVRRSYIGGNSGTGFSCLQQKDGYTTALVDSVVCGNVGGDYNCDGKCNIAGDAPNACSAVNTTDCGGYCDSHDDFCVSGSGYFAGPYDTGCAECGGPCDTGNFTCPDYAVCVDGVAANYTCVCPTGFTGNGTVPCDDVDECSLGIDNCAAIASCSNTIGSFDCDCPSGYWGTGVYCVDIDECAQANSTSCAAGANCANVPGSVTCECAAGTFGDGYTSCTSCPTNAGSVAGSSNLTDCSCNTGFFNLYGDAAADCVPCPPGWAVSALGGDVYVCSQCPPDTYSATNNAGECTDCPTQSTTNGVAGSTNCSCVDDFAFNANTSRCETYCPPGTSRSDDAIACIDCAPGTYSDSPNADDCTSCPLNSLSAASGSVSVANCTCVSGYAVPVGGAVGADCERWCPAGSYRPSPFSLDCPVCDIGSYSDTPNVGACTPCPNNAVTPTSNSTAITDCECPPNYYTPERERGTECRPCPSGAKCKGGVGWPVARKGYIYVEGDDGSAGFAECVPFEACAGNGQCAEGYTGDLCERCKPDFYRLDGLCYECQNNAWLIVLACGLALFLFCAVLVWFNSQDRAINKFASIVIGVNALQIAGMYGRLNLNWPPLAQRFFAVLSLVNFNIELVSPECAVSVNDPFVLRWLLTMFFPVLVVAIFASIAAIGTVLMMASCCGYDPTVSKWNPRYLRHTCIRAFYQLMTIGYLPLSAAVFEFFYCVKDASGVRVISTARQTVCYTSTYWGLFPVALLCLCLYPIGVPLFCGFLLRTKRESLGMVKFSLRYGFLVGRFSGEYYYFELAIMARKLGVAFAMSFLTDNAYVKAAGAIVVLVASYSAQLRLTPYRTQLYNLLEDACLLASVLILLVSVMFQAGGTDEVTRAVCVVTLLCGLLCIIAAGLGADAYTVLVLERELDGGEEERVAVVASAGEGESEFDAIAGVAKSTDCVPSAVPLDTPLESEGRGSESGGGEGPEGLSTNPVWSEKEV